MKSSRPYSNGNKSTRPGPLEREPLCIRFVNTKAWRLRDPAEERLPTPAALIAWLKDNDIGAANQLEVLSNTWRDDTAYAASILSVAIRLREAIYEIFRARIRSAEIPADAVEFLNSMLVRPSPAVYLVPLNTGFGWQLDLERSEPTDLLKPVALSAAELLASPRAARVRQCQDPDGCGWLFVDESRMQNRRWCSMGDCGNRAKARRYRQRAKLSS
jgi:predicted RNA-binding Zn ribbon-like protein